MTLWYSPGHDLVGDRNAGFDEALALLNVAAERHPQEVTIVDASAMSTAERWDIYQRPATAAPYWQYAVRQVFGSQRSPAFLAGGSVPLLYIWFREVPNLPLGAPYEDWQERPPVQRHRGPVVPIRSVLAMLSESEQVRLFGRTVLQR